jgi:hypothetical protein
MKRDDIEYRKHSGQRNVEYSRSYYLLTSGVLAPLPWIVMQHVRHVLGCLCTDGGLVVRATSKPETGLQLKPFHAPKLLRQRSPRRVGWTFGQEPDYSVRVRCEGGRVQHSTVHLEVAHFFTFLSLHPVYFTHTPFQIAKHIHCLIAACGLPALLTL